MPNEWPKNETFELKKEKENVAQALEKIKSTGIFNEEYFNGLNLVIFSGKKSVGQFKSGEIQKTDFEKYKSQDFMQGRRTDFVVIHPRKEFENSDVEKLDDRLILPFIFVEGRLTYNEFLVHEMAHNVFDKEYIERCGNFKDEKNGITNVSSEYKEKIKLQIKELLESYYPKFDIEKLDLKRQKIAEIYAMLYEREYCRRTDENLEVHNKVKGNVDLFMSDPERSLSDFNAQHGRKCTMEDFYDENHIISLIVAPLLEEKYPTFIDRIKFFWE
jgi:hypothetical protein